MDYGIKKISQVVDFEAEIAIVRKLLQGFHFCSRASYLPQFIYFSKNFKVVYSSVPRNQWDFISVHLILSSLEGLVWPCSGTNQSTKI